MSEVPQVKVGGGAVPLWEEAGCHDEQEWLDWLAEMEDEPPTKGT